MCFSSLYGAHETSINNVIFMIERGANIIPLNGNFIGYSLFGTLGTYLAPLFKPALGLSIRL